MPLRRYIELKTQTLKDGYYNTLQLLSRLAQLVERKTLNLVVVGSSPTVGVHG